MATFLEGIHAIVFDAVGTVLHPEPPAPSVYAKIGRRYGSRLTPPVIAGRFVSAFAKEETLDLQTGLRTSEARERERWQRIVAEVLDDVSDPDACFQELFEHFSRPDAWRCDPDAARTIQELDKRGYLLGMASNHDRRLRSVVAGLPALQPLSYLVISSEVGWRKPAPNFFAAVCRVVGFSPENVLHVGDDLTNDFEGARAAGLRAVLLDAKEAAPVEAGARIRNLRSLF